MKPNQPSADEQHVMEHLTDRLVQPHEIERFDQRIVEHHYLKSAELVGEHLRYVAIYKGQWLALAAWCAPALHLKPRDALIDWKRVSPGYWQVRFVNGMARVAEFVNALARLIVPGFLLPSTAFLTTSLTRKAVQSPIISFNPSSSPTLPLGDPVKFSPFHDAVF
ncbi:MAG: DUF4338 domain-containing protein [Verrucomicrobia bacterium]|nr:DUF4338 domain-containing protein [Verrucomicrobiota bacterium]